MNSENSEFAPQSSGIAFVTRLLVPGFFVGLAIWQIVEGVGALPVWMSDLSGRAGVESEVVLRVMIGVELAGACVMLLLGRAAKAMAVAILGAACFVIIAEISRLGTAPGMILRVGALVAAVVLLGLVLAIRSECSSGSARPAQVISALTGVIAAGVVAFAWPLAAPTIATQQPAVDEIVRTAGLEKLDRHVFLLEPETWVNHNVKDLPWAPGLPDEVIAEMQTGEQLVVFYRPDDELCIRVIENYIAAVAPTAAWAIRVPAAPGADPQANIPTAIRCQNCTQVRLPSGITYFISLPLVLRVSDGIVKHYSVGNDEVAIEICLEALP